MMIASLSAVSTFRAENPILLTGWLSLCASFSTAKALTIQHLQRRVALQFEFGAFISAAKPHIVLSHNPLSLGCLLFVTEKLG
jgi:hypothetical protein